MTPLPSPATCPKCRAPLPAQTPHGLCPACLMDAGGTETEVIPGGEEFAAPLDLERLRRAFPHLEILSPLGAGGMGRVYRVRQPNLDRMAALKVLPPELARDAAWVGRFTREARALARLNHPNIVQVYDVGQVAGPDGTPLCWLLMEYVDGVTLRQVQRTGGLSAREALALIPKLCDALQYAHEKGVLHRDIKPENILLDAAGTVKVADFGLAKLAGTESAPALTQIGARLGTAAYMAPAQIESPGDVDHRADIYSLGVVLYELLTGGLPLGRFPAPSQKSGIDPRLDQVVFRTLEKERERRYQAAGEVRTALEEAQKDSDAGDGRVRVRPRRLPERVESERMEAHGGAEGPVFSTNQLILLAIVLLCCAIGFSAGWRPALFVLSLCAGCGILLWLILVMNVDNRRGFAALSGRMEAGKRAQPHGCMAMVAFVMSMLLVLMPPAVATWMLLYWRMEIPWIAGVAACGALSFAAVQPLLKLTGMHRGAAAQRRGGWLMVAGTVLCALGMAGGAVLDTVWLPGQQVQELFWGDRVYAGKLTRRDVDRVVQETFGPDNRGVTVTGPGSPGKWKAAFWTLTIAGPPSSGITEGLLLCAAKFNGVVHDGDSINVPPVRLVVRQPLQWGNIDVHWYVTPVWLMAGGAWLLAVRARSRRKWLAPAVILGLLAGGAWVLRYSHAVIPGLTPSFRSVPVPIPADADLRLPDVDPDAALPRPTVLRWLWAVRRGDQQTAEACQAYLFEGPLSHQEILRAARLLRIDDVSGAGAESYVDCHVAIRPLNGGGDDFWECKSVRFYLYEAPDKTLIRRIVFQ